MSYQRLGFAINKTFKLITITCLFIPVLLVVTWMLFTIPSDFTVRTLAVLIVIASLGYLSYWLRFYYKMYDIHLVTVQGPWPNASNPLNLRYYKSVEISQRDRFGEREKGSIRDQRVRHVDNPNAILYGDILVVATSQEDTFADIEEVIREDQRGRGLRWINNFPVGKGVRGFVTNSGNFHTFSDYRQELVLQNRL